MTMHECTVEPLNKRHIGDSINSAVLSSKERLPLLEVLNVLGNVI